MTSSDEMWPCLPVLVLRIELEMESRFRLPAFAGSLFRGCMGWALKDLCTHADYEILFEPKQQEKETARPFVLVPPLGQRELREGDRIALTLKLIGYGCCHVHTYLEAFHKIGRYGLGRARARYRVARMIADEGRQVWVCYDRDAGGQLYIPQPRSLKSFSQHSIRACHRLEVKFLTPTRIVDAGKPSMSPDTSLILRAAYRRLRGLLGMNGYNTETWDYRGRIQSAAHLIASSMTRWTWEDWSRQSSRQQRRITMGGLVGSARWEGPLLSETLEVLRAAEVLHLGKATAFGMGMVSFRPLPVTEPPNHDPPRLLKKENKEMPNVAPAIP